MMKVTRRGFLQTGAVGLGALGASLKGWAHNSEPIDALIIGSGFGGAIAALRLAKAGVRTVVLERGRRWPITDKQDTFATFDNPDGRAAWLSTETTGLPPFTPVDKYTGVLERIVANGMEVRNGAGVGGGSLAYNAIMLQPRRKLFEMVFPRQIDYDELDSVYYPRVRKIIKPATIPDDILATEFYASTRVNLEQAKAAGFFKGKLVEYGIDFDVVREEIAGTKRPSAIDGQSWYGLNSGAKSSVDRNYLAMAEKTGKVDVLPLHIVTDIMELRRGVYAVAANEIDTNGTVLRKRMFVCKRLFMAAGSMGTSALLVKAREKGTLPRLTKKAGKFWGSNGDFIAVRAGLPPDNNAGTGGPCGHFVFEDLKNIYSPTDMVELVYPKDQAFPGGSLYVGLGVAPPVGFFTYDKTTDAATLNWPGDDPTLRPFQAGAETFLKTLNDKNGTIMPFFSTALTAHPVGGAVAGETCDFFGRVFDHPGLYIVDGAFVPGGSVGGVNPSLTIAALAERSMRKIVASDIEDCEDRDRGSKDDQKDDDDDDHKDDRSSVRDRVRAKVLA